MDGDNVNHPTEVEATLAAGAALTTNAIRDVHGTPVAVVPNGYELDVLERLLGAPRRAAGSTRLGEETSFIHQVKRLAGPSTVIYVEPLQRLDVPPKLVAVFNDHGSADAPGWRDHRAAFQPLLSKEWATWAGASGRQQPHADFARFIEDNLPDVAVPPAGQMLEIALSIEAKKKVSFASGLRLQNGTQQLTFEETIEGTAAKGQLTIPETISLGIPVLSGGARYRVDARLRYRINDARLMLWIELVRPHEILQHALDEMVRRIVEETGVMMLVGHPD